MKEAPERASSAREGSGVAERLYYDSPALTFSATVTDIRLVATERGVDGGAAQVWEVALDRSAFYPESGGQPWDTGVLVATARSGATLEVTVEQVVEDEAGEVWHRVRKPLVQGTAVEGRVDAARRRDHMQQHSGQHLLSAVLLEQLGARTASFHLGTEVATIDLALPAGVERLEQDVLVTAEEAVNAVIAEDRPLRLHWVSRVEAEAMLAEGRLRKLPERQGPLRVVEMEGVEWNACGGTHVRSTAAIGGLLLRQPEKVKGGWRLPFVCGLRAVRAARQDFTLLGETARQLSTGGMAVPERVRQLQAENKAAAKQVQALLEQLADGRATELLRATAEGVIEAVLSGLPATFARLLALRLSEKGRAALIVVQEAADVALALSFPEGDVRHAGKLLGAACAETGNRGGGGAQLAQAVCPAGQLAELMTVLRARL